MVVTVNAVCQILGTNFRLSVNLDGNKEVSCFDPNGLVNF